MADVADNAPNRVRKKVDKQPRVADEWKWSRKGGVFSIAAGAETVRLKTADGVAAALDDVTCTCLLSPRCFHVLAVLSVCRLDDATETDDDVPPDENADDTDLGGEEIDTTDEQREAAEVMWREASAVLAAGARAVGTLLQSRLLRAIHECRNVGLHRLAASGLRVMQNIRLLRDEDDTFNSEQFLEDLREQCTVARRLADATDHLHRQWHGVARRQYSPLPSLRLQGLFTEAVATRSGYHGVATYLMGDDGDIYTVSNVRPEETGYIKQAYKTGADLGGLSVPHNKLSRQGLLLQKATRSVDGRIGGGQSCRGVTSKGEGWEAAPVARRFDTPLAAQIESAFRFAPLPPLEQPADFDLVFVRGVVQGAAGQHLVLDLADDAGTLFLTIAIDRDPLLYRENLTLLSRAPGLAVRCLARLDLSTPGCAAALAIAPDSGEREADVPKLSLPASKGGHVDLGLELIRRGDLTTAERQPVVIAAAPRPHSIDGLDSLRRRLRGIALGGRHALPSGRLGDVQRDARALSAQMQPHAAALLVNLAQSARDTRTELSGERFPADSTVLAERWLAAAAYEDTARRHFHQQQWEQCLGAAVQ